MSNLKKQFPFRGLDLRSNLLNRAGNTASDCLNVLLDSRRRLVNRSRFTDLDLASKGLVGEIYDIVPYKLKNKLIVFTRSDQDLITGLYRVRLWEYTKESDTLVELGANNFGEIVDPSTEVRSTATDFVSYLEYNNNLYFILDIPTNEAPADYTSLHRYDGRYWNTSGMFEPSYDISGAGSGRYARAFFFQYDDNQNFVAGDYSDFADAATVKISQRFNPQHGENNFQTASVAIDRNLGSLQDNLTTYMGRQVVELTTHVNNVACRVGDTMKIQSELIDRYVDGILVETFRALAEFKVYAIDDSDNANYKIYLDAQEYRIYNHLLQIWTDVNTPVGFSAYPVNTGDILGNVFLAVYSSLNGVNWTFDRVELALNNNLDIQTTLFFNVDPANPHHVAENYPSFLEITQDYDNGFDEVAVRGLAPYGKGIATYGGSFLIIDDNNVFISDGLSDGSSIENFRGAGQSLTVGTSKDGPITGIFANENFIAVFREREAYHITGDIFNSNYRNQSFYSTEIGCSSQAGIVELAGYCYFPSPRGFYFAKQGAAMEELSDSIEPLFKDDVLNLQFDMSKVRTEVDFVSEYILSYVKTDSGEPRVIAYSYYWKEWFLLDIDAKAGMSFLGEDFYYCDGSKVLIADEASEERVYSKYTSNFETLGEPSIEKKFQQLRVFSLNAKEFDLNLKTSEDWNEDDITTDVELDLSKPFDTKRFDSDRNFSRRFTLENNSRNDIIIDGYEYEYRLVQKKMKGNHG